MQAKTQYVNETIMWRLAPLLLLSLVGAYSLLTIHVLVNGQTTDVITYAVLALWFVVLATIYLAKRGHQGTSLCSIPAILTIIGLVEFIGVPTWRFINGDERMDDDYVRALSIVLVAYVAFWIGSWAFMRDGRLRFEPEAATTPARTVLAAVCMLTVGGIASVIEWQLGIYAYMRDTQLESMVAYAQWLDSGAQLLGGALLISGIEVLGRNKSTVIIRLIFCLSLGLMLGFGAISGMKIDLLK